ncbi:hypothetical protein ACQR3Q_14280 [Dietzia natronolimnaea]|uniref:hypothetical protein n=1 Tax=Dietzia natronolimnaea TaxID=161920 RepID=UPI003D13FBAD
MVAHGVRGQASPQRCSGALAEVSGDWVSSDAGIRHLHKARINPERALGNLEDYNGLIDPRRLSQNAESGAQ